MKNIYENRETYLILYFHIVSTFVPFPQSLCIIFNTLDVAYISVSMDRNKQIFHISFHWYN